MLAGALPMLRQALVELSRQPGGIDGFLDGVLTIVGDLRDDNGKAALLVPRGLSAAAGLYRVTDVDAVKAAHDGELVSVAGAGYRALGVRQEHPGGMAALPGAGPTADS